MNTETFISQHANDDVRSLALQKAKYPDVDMNYALDQIAGRQMARHKLPSWATKDGVVYPPHLSMEQCSSEFTANYKAQLVRDLVRSRKNSLPIDSLLLVDLTAGFGVDFTMMAKALSEDGLSSDEKMICVERQENLCNILRHNLSIMEINQTEVICGDGVGYLHGLNHACVVFLDPARRDVHGGRTFAISDCTPDVLSIQRELMEKSDFVILKLSPMLDIHATVEVLGIDNVRSIHVVSVANECKELLVVLSKKQGESPQIHCVNDAFTFSCPFQDNTPLSVTQQINEGLYLYEPNASLMKTRCFGLLCQKYGVESIGVNSHLFVSSRLIDDFPGRKFRIIAISSLNKKDLKNHLQGIANANITTRNFPLSVQELRKRLKLRDGGNTYIFATTIGNTDHRLLICQS